MKYTTIYILIAAVALGLFLTYLTGQGGRKSRTTLSVKIPAQFSTLASKGKQNFEANCAVCHGQNAAGTENGPPLVHIIYEPNHHSDYSFFRAVKQGVRAHHWKFGDMPPLPNVKEDEVAAIVQYVRELQRENGIF